MSKEALSSEPYKGVRDFYPADWARLSSTFAVLRRVLGEWGYEEYQASPLERSELYESKGNEEIINEQTYTFTDRGERRVTLRPEMTPTLARMVAAKRRELPFPLRWYSIPNVFRYERPQRGRLREHYQLNVDLLGLSEGEADVEMITIASRLLTAFGASEKDFIIKVNSRRLLSAACEAAGLTEGALRTYWQLLDKRAKMSAEDFETARKEFVGDPLRITEEESDPEVKRLKQELDVFIDTLKARGIQNVVYDSSIIRGFDYYTGFVFEVFDTNPENPRSLFGGGRYDGLVALFGGDPIPAVGCAMGDVTLIDFLETHGLLPGATEAPELYIGTPTVEDVAAAQAFAQNLRENGLRVFVNLTEKALGDQIRDASRRAIPYFIAYGASETESGMVRMKTLDESTEEELRIEDVPARIRRLG